MDIWDRWEWRGSFEGLRRGSLKFGDNDTGWRGERKNDVQCGAIGL